MTPGPRSAAAREDDARPDERSLAAVHRTDLAVDALADRSAVDGPGATTDPIAALLAGWVTAIDQEVAVALHGRAVPAPPSAPVPSTPARVVPGAQVRAQPPSVPSVSQATPVRAAVAARLQWRVLSASAAAVIAVLAVGVGLQDTAQVGPGASSVAESVQSVESTLVASMLAAEAGDVAGARVLLEQARSLVAALPEDQRMLWETALGHTERGLLSAEEAVRAGQPVPALVGLVPGAYDRLGPGASGAEVGRARTGEQGTPLERAGSDGQGAGPGDGRADGSGAGQADGSGNGQADGSGNGQGNGAGNGHGNGAGNGHGDGVGGGVGPDIGQGTGRPAGRERPDRGATAPTPPPAASPSPPRSTAPGSPATTGPTAAPTAPATPSATPRPPRSDPPRTVPTRRPDAPGGGAPGAEPGPPPGAGPGTTDPRGGRDEGRGKGRPTTGPAPEPDRGRGSAGAGRGPLDPAAGERATTAAEAPGRGRVEPPARPSSRP